MKPCISTVLFFFSFRKTILRSPGQQRDERICPPLPLGRRLHRHPARPWSLLRKQRLRIQLGQRGHHQFDGQNCLLRVPWQQFFRCAALGRFLGVSLRTHVLFHPRRSLKFTPFFPFFGGWDNAKITYCSSFSWYFGLLFPPVSSPIPKSLSPRLCFV